MQLPTASSSRLFSPALQAVPCVLDTNIVLDLLVFNDPRVQPLRAGLQAGTLLWMATQPMREELLRVLGYPRVAVRLQRVQGSASQVLAQMDALVQWRDVAPEASVRCEDPDDQKFIDLAVAHQTLLLSKDRAVLCLHKKLLALGVRVQAVAVAIDTAGMV